MSESEGGSIYPIHQLYFQCDGCKAQWMIRVDPPIKGIEDFKAFTQSPEKMKPCPMNCGGRTCSIAFRAGPMFATRSGVDPFEMFKKGKGESP